MRPPRRSKWISALPDILEYPEPLHDRRGTLALFQFPWGEKSDSATVTFRSQMRPVRPGAPPVFPTIETQVRSQQSQGYLSSFDDYDDDEAGGDKDSSSSDDDDDDGEDDSFDEATLWEIASLKSDKVPSRESLFPGHGDDRRQLPSVAGAQRGSVPLTEADAGTASQPSRDGATAGPAVDRQGQICDRDQIQGAAPA